MTAVACNNLEFGRTRFDFSACGCSSNASFDRFSVRNYAKGTVRNDNRSHKARKLFCFRPEIGPPRMFSTKTPEALLPGTAFWVLDPILFIDLIVKLVLEVLFFEIAIFISFLV